MTRSLLRAVALASALAFLAAPIVAQSPSSAATAPKSITTLGCYSHPDPLVQQGTWTFQTSGYCQTQCLGLDKAVMAITGGSTCYCGDELPSLDSEASDDKCNSPCNGYDQEDCGGIGYWQVYLTGLTGDVATASNSSASSSSTSPTQGSQSSSTTQPAVVTKAGETVVVTASAAASQSSPGGGPNKVAIAVGVVVGVLGLSALIGGVLLFLRRKRNRQIEEEHRRNAAISSFVGSQKSDKSSTDQRLDPSIYSHRRQSIGSIADERDFSRRILQVSW